MRPFTSLTTLVLLALLLAPLSGASAGAQAPTPPPPAVAQVVRIDFHSQAQLEDLASRLDVWEVHKDAGWLLAYVSLAEMDSLRQAGYTVTPDLARTRAVNTPPRVDPLQTSGIPGFPCYRTVEETLARLAELTTLYPALAQVSVIGSSWDKLTPGGPAGYDLQVISLTNSAIPGPKPHFFLIAEIHARELTTAETALRFAETLLQNYGSDPDVTWLLDYYEVDILPMANPDGRKFAEQGLWWRKNTDSVNACTTYDAGLGFIPYGTDLNRNSSFRWGDPDTYLCREDYKGPSAASEPEVQAIQAYASSLFPALHLDPNVPAPLDYSGLFITLHSFGGYVLWGYGDTYSPAPNATQLQTLGRKLAFFNNYIPGQSSVVLYQTRGTTDDWAYGTLGVPGFTFEMGTDFFETCSSFEGTVWPQNRDALLYAFKAARLPYQAPAGPEVLAAQVSSPSVLQGAVVSLSASANDARYRPTTPTSEPVQAIQAARYSIDQPSWAEGAALHPLQASDGSFDASSEALAASLGTLYLAPGRHILFIEAQDAAGNWGVPSAAFFTVLPAGWRIFAPIVAR